MPQRRPWKKNNLSTKTPRPLWMGCFYGQSSYSAPLRREFRRHRRRNCAGRIHFARACQIKGPRRHRCRWDGLPPCRPGEGDCRSEGHGRRIIFQPKHPVPCGWGVFMGNPRIRRLCAVNLVNSRRSRLIHCFAAPFPSRGRLSWQGLTWCARGPMGSSGPTQYGRVYR